MYTSSANGSFPLRTPESSKFSEAYHNMLMAKPADASTRSIAEILSVRTSEAEVDHKHKFDELSSKERPSKQ